MQKNFFVRFFYIEKARIEGAFYNSLVILTDAEQRLLNGVRLTKAEKQDLKRETEKYFLFLFLFSSRFRYHVRKLSELEARAFFNQKILKGVRI